LSRAEPINSRPNSKQPAKARQGLVWFCNGCHLNSSTDNLPCRDPTQRGGQRGGQSNGGGDDLEARRGATGEQPIGEIGDRGEQSTQAPTVGRQNRAGKDVEMRKHPSYLQADKGKRLGGQGVRDRVGKTGEKSGQPSHEGVGMNGARGGQLARAISLASAHPHSPRMGGQRGDSGESNAGRHNLRRTTGGWTSRELA
jgi:hypothetical protein